MTHMLEHYGRHIYKYTPTHLVKPIEQPLKLPIYVRIYFCVVIEHLYRIESEAAAAILGIL